MELSRSSPTALRPPCSHPRLHRRRPRSSPPPPAPPAPPPPAIHCHPSAPPSISAGAARRGKYAAGPAGPPRPAHLAALLALAPRLAGSTHQARGRVGACHCGVTLPSLSAAMLEPPAAGNMPPAATAAGPRIPQTWRVGPHWTASPTLPGFGQDSAAGVGPTRSFHPPARRESHWQARPCTRITRRPVARSGSRYESHTERSGTACNPPPPPPPPDRPRLSSLLLGAALGRRP